MLNTSARSRDGAINTRDVNTVCRGATTRARAPARLRDAAPCLSFFCYGAARDARQEATSHINAQMRVPDAAA